MQGVQTCNLRRLAYEISPVVMPGDFVRVALRQGAGPRSRSPRRRIDGGRQRRADLVGGPEVMLQVRRSCRRARAGSSRIPRGRRAPKTAERVAGGTLRPCRRRPSWLPGSGGASARRQFARLGGASVLDRAVGRRGRNAIASSVIPADLAWKRRWVATARAVRRSDSVRAGSPSSPTTPTSWSCTARPAARARSLSRR